MSLTSAEITLELKKLNTNIALELTRLVYENAALGASKSDDKVINSFNKFLKFLEKNKQNGLEIKEPGLSLGEPLLTDN